jgi:hypothetical protein
LYQTFPNYRTQTPNPTRTKCKFPNTHIPKQRNQQQARPALSTPRTKTRRARSTRKSQAPVAPASKSAGRPRRAAAEGGDGERGRDLALPGTAGAACGRPDAAGFGACDRRKGRARNPSPPQLPLRLSLSVPFLTSLASSR